MYSEKKVTKEDTWRPADLRRHVREKAHGDDYSKRRDDNEKKRRGGESTERPHRDPEVSRQERDKLRERERSRETGNEDKKDRHAERRKDGSQDHRGDKDRDRKDERDREKRRLVDDDREHRERRRDREKHERERVADREKQRIRDTERHSEEDRDKRRQDRDKDSRREERDREQRSERRQHEERGIRRRDHEDKQHREQRDQRHRSDYEDIRKDRETEEKHGYRKHSERQEDREYKEEYRRHKEEREKRHKEKRYHDEKQKYESESRKPQVLKGSGEEVRHSQSNRDRTERDKHSERRKKEEEERERRHKERKHREEDIERNHRDGTSLKKSSSDKSNRREKQEAVSEVVNDEDLAEQTYEEDFEDYEEDFEEMDDSADEGEDEKEPLHPEVEDEKEELTVQQRKEILAIQRAMAEENERAGTAQSRQCVSREEEDGLKQSKGSENNQSKSSQRGKFMDFVAAKQREVNMKVASKQKKRGAELLRLIDLDFSVTFSVLDLPPVSEYEMYIRNFGNANTKQAYSQCNENDADRDIQTEETETCEKWTQHPPDHSGPCGDPNLSQGAQDKSGTDINFDSQCLSFLRSASQVMVVLLEEDQAERKSLREPNTQTESLTFSSGSLQLSTKLPFLNGRQISMVHFSQVQKHTMLSVHMPVTKQSAVRLDSNTIICIWNIWEPSRPQKILVYESEVQCCCFSSGKSTLVFAGTSVGSVLLWDLREHASNHYNLKIGEDEWTFRQPTFSTDAVMASSGHFSSVTSIEVVPSTAAAGLRPGASLLASEEESSGLSFQLASLDESGVLNFWVVVELSKGNEAGSLADLGLRPGGKVKLLHSSSLLTAERVSQRDALKTGPVMAQVLKFLPSDSNHFFIGTNLGRVNHGTSHGLKAPPKFYMFQDVEVRPADVNSIDFSPFRPNFFLVGCGDGSIRLHTVRNDQPVAEWRSSTAGEPVVSVQWAQTRPTVFCVLDAASNLHIWDLFKNDAQPVVTERMHSDRVTAMAVFGDSGRHSTYSGIALAHESGKIQMQYFTTNLTVSSSEEEKKLESLMTEAF